MLDWNMAPTNQLAARLSLVLASTAFACGDDPLEQASLPDAEYEQDVRPSLVSQLLASGFAQGDVDAILSNVDYSRRIQGIH